MLICGLQPKDRQTAKDLMMILGLNKAIDQSVMESSEPWYSHVLRKDNCHA